MKTCCFYVSGLSSEKNEGGVPINAFLILIVLLYSWVADVDFRLMITEAYLEPSQTVTKDLFATSEMLQE